jgi:hypothetical protein
MASYEEASIVVHLARDGGGGGGTSDAVSVDKRQGLTLVHVSSQPEPFPTQNIPYIPPQALIPPDTS